MANPNHVSGLLVLLTRHWRPGPKTKDNRKMPYLRLSMLFGLINWQGPYSLPDIEQLQTSINDYGHAIRHSSKPGNGYVAQWASYQICKIAGCACAGNVGNVFPRRRFQRKPLVSDPGMHHGTCVTHVPWCMPGSLTCGHRENVPGIPGAFAPAILCNW